MAPGRSSSPKGSAPTGKGRGAGPTTPKGSDPRGGASTSDDATCQGDAFTPGQNGTLTWNTTQDIEGRPILLYVLDAHSPTGTSYDFSRKLELEFLKDKTIVEAAEDFVCEKVCFKDQDFLGAVKGREPVQAWLAANLAKAEQRSARLVLLDSGGQLLRSIDWKELANAKPAWLLRELKKALKTNQQHLAPGPRKG